MKSALLKLSTQEVIVSIVYSWVWAVTEWDILMGQWSDTILVGFSVWVLPTARYILDASKLEFISSDIIYNITDRIWKIVTWMLDFKEIEVALWRVKVGWIFFTGEKFMIIWLVVPNGAKVEVNAQSRVLRNKKVLWNWKIESLKQWIVEVKEVEWPIECWIKLATGVKIELWDELEIFKMEKQK
jgi:translation initiation factor IF-2